MQDGGIYVCGTLIIDYYAKTLALPAICVQKTCVFIKEALFKICFMV